MAKADASITDVLDRTPIYLAAERGHTTSVDFLADKFKVLFQIHLDDCNYFLMECAG